MPRLIVFCLCAGFVGTDSYEFAVFPDDVTEDELNAEAWQRAVNHAEMYGVYSGSEYGADPDITDEELDSDDYSDDIDGYWEEFDPAKHDGHVVGNGTATELFERLLKEFNE
jgi:hypothetical protein